MNFGSQNQLFIVIFDFTEMAFRSLYEPSEQSYEIFLIFTHSTPKYFYSFYTKINITPTTKGIWKNSLGISRGKICLPFPHKNKYYPTYKGYLEKFPTKYKTTFTELSIFAPILG